jgi:hypothetical protein
VWKEKTYKELQFTREFKLKYLKQHYQSIKMYMNWVRPYLKTIKQLQMGPGHEGSNFDDPDIIGAFETAKIEIELLARQKDKGLKYYPLLQIKFNYVTRPEMIYTPQGQKQPMHAGRTEIEIIPHVVTQEQIDEYLEMQKTEDIELLAALNESMMALKDDLKKYLAELGEFKEEKKKEEEKPKPQNVWSMFSDLGGAFKDLFGAFGGITFRDKAKNEAKKLAAQRKKAEDTAKSRGRLMYYVFKKATKLYTEI